MAELIALCTCPDRESALRLARALVVRRLAACVNVVPGVTSVYRWQDGLQEDDEVQLLVKTTRGRFEALAEAVRELHPYELPELVAVEIAAGLPDYLAWVRAETGAPPA